MRRLDQLLQRVRVAKVAPYIASGSRVLDIGCAEGSLYRCVPNLASYVGVDPDAPCWSAPNARFVRGVFPNDAIASDEEFDVITVLAVLEHIPQAAQSRFARACVHHLVPGGRVAVTVPSPTVDHVIRALQWAGALDGMHAEEHYGYDPRATPALFEAAGLQLERHVRFELGMNHLFLFRRPRG